MKVAVVSLCKNSPEYIPIGLVSLTSYLKQKMPQHDFRLVDACYEDPLTEIQNGDFNLVGIGSMTAEYEDAVNLGANLKSLGIPIIIGGIHISRMPGSLADCFSCGVVGEGEQTFEELIALYEQTSDPDLSQIQGVVRRDSLGRLVTNPARPPLDLHSYPALDYGCINPGYFQKRILTAFSDIGIEGKICSSRGCPYKCLFCASGHARQSVSYHSVDWVVNEVRSLWLKGANYIVFVDDLFAGNKTRLKLISEALCLEGLDKKVAFHCSLRANMIDDETCQILKSMNVKSVFLGFESGNNRVLSFLKGSNATVEDNKKAVILCARHGLNPWGNVIVGSPTETLSEMEDTLQFARWARTNGADRVCMTVMTPYPGTPMWEIARQRGVVPEDSEFKKLNNREKDWLMHSLLLDKSIDLDDFEKFCRRLMRELSWFKWHRIRRLMRKNPLQATRLIIRTPWPVLFRLLLSR